MCACGCGEKASPGKDFVRGHNARRGDGQANLPLGAEATRSEAPGYSAAHERIALALGPASEQDCVDCGRQARDWSFKNPTGHSADPADYSARCRPCHAAVDEVPRKLAQVWT